MKKVYLFLIYVFVIISLFPLVQFEYYRRTLTLEHSPVSSFWVDFRSSYSVLFLIVCGIVLLWKYSRVHKILGAIFMIVGLYYFINIVRDFG